MPLNKFLMKRISFKAVTLRTRSNQYKAELIQDFISSGVLDKIANEEFKVKIHTVLSLEDIVLAH